MRPSPKHSQALLLFPLLLAYGIPTVDFQQSIRALCDTCDPELLPDVRTIACAAPEENLRTLAIRACVRLTTQEETIKLTVKQRVELLRATSS